ncbi:uncharacterized protein C11orf16 homolog isoform X1 [Erinaceus europaeus]|uniref:Uncharacterized protein C11orf16 homolog isoform X1 n=2 Tax=Erinaceus europaeus TaxID=9365 RepID=A0A1S3WLJ9_ERIEU|nr:uncharacterized protein C11orf16 homolog isoform X1 [Erinaceus europaeus]
MATCSATRVRWGEALSSKLSGGDKAAVKAGSSQLWVAYQKAMKSASGPRMPFPKYCSVATVLTPPVWTGTGALSFTCPLGPTSHNPFTRYTHYHPRLHMANSTWHGPGWPGRDGDAADTWVLSRRGPDGLYYRAQIKTAPELERQGALLVEFEAPLVTGPNLPNRWQSIVLKEDVIQFSSPVKHPLQPGDKVLAPWEPDQQRYGPGTVLLGMEERHPQRAPREEITVHFWNGKTAIVPVGGVRWVPPDVWKEAVERLHRPCTRGHPGPLLGDPFCSLLEPSAGCVPSGFPMGAPLLFSPCHTCCQSLCQGCVCSCPLVRPTWWPLTRASGVIEREHPEEELKSTTQLPLEGLTENKATVQVPIAVSSSSSSSEEEDLKNELETSVPQKLMVDSTVNTDPILLEKSPRQSGLCQPKWKHWRRNGPELNPWKPGTRRCKIQKEKIRDKQQRVQASVLENTDELVLKAANMKLLEILPEKAIPRKLKALPHARGSRIPENLGKADVW